MIQQYLVVDLIEKNEGLVLVLQAVDQLPHIYVAVLNHIVFAAVKCVLGCFVPLGPYFVVGYSFSTILEGMNC